MTGDLYSFCRSLDTKCRWLHILICRKFVLDLGFSILNEDNDSRNVKCVNDSQYNIVKTVDGGRLIEIVGYRCQVFFPYDV